MKIREIQAKGILSKSQVYEYALNPYVGRQHGCVYCYAKFMKRFTGHSENPARRHIPRIGKTVTP